MSYFVLELYSVTKIYKLIIVQGIWLFFYININNLVTLGIPSYFRIFEVALCETFVVFTWCFAMKKKIIKEDIAVKICQL
jgi:hypothetical protein